MDRFGIYERPEYASREYEDRGTIRCEMIIYVGEEQPLPRHPAMERDCHGFLSPGYMPSGSPKGFALPMSDLREAPRTYSDEILSACQEEPPGLAGSGKDFGRTWTA